MVALVKLEEPQGCSQRTDSERKSLALLHELKRLDLRYATSYWLGAEFHLKSSKHEHGSHALSEDGRPQSELHLSIGSTGRHLSYYADCSLGMVCVSGLYDAEFGIHPWSALPCRKDC